MPERLPGNVAILPGFVRFDRDLRASAKLLYAEITALENYTGYCWASNRYLSDLLGLSVKTVSELIQQLAEKEYIFVEITRDDKGAVLCRKIRTQSPIRSVTLPELGEAEAPPEKSGYPSPEKSGYPPPKNVKAINDNSIDNGILPPIAPKSGSAGKTAKPRGKRQEPKKAPDCCPEAFAAFWDSYPRGESKQAAIRAWDTLAPSADDLRAMAAGLARAKASEMWKKGIGIPYASTWLNQRRWTDDAGKISAISAPSAPSQDGGSYWAADPEVLG